MTALRKRFEVFSLSIMQSAFCLPYVKVITVPAACLVHNFRHERTVKTILVREKRLNAASVPENNFKVKTTIEFVDTRLELLFNYFALEQKSCIYKFYGCFDLKIIFRNTRRIESFFPYKDRLNRSLMSKVVYKASCWDCDDFYIGKTKRRLHDRKTEHFKALAKSCHTSAIADHITSTGHNIKWDHFDILATGRSDLHCKIKETLLIRELQPALNENVGSENLFLY